MMRVGDLVSRFRKPSRPVILWDIDGCLNPTMSPTLIEDGFVAANEGYMRWWLNPNTHGLWMKRLESKVTNVWVSSWGEDSNFVNRFFNLKSQEWPHVPLDEYADGKTWKLSSVRAWVDRHVTPDGKLVWIDDELHADAKAWALRRPNTLLIKCNPLYGFTADQLQQIQTFISS